MDIENCNLEIADIEIDSVYSKRKELVRKVKGGIVYFSCSACNIDPALYTKFRCPLGTLSEIEDFIWEEIQSPDNMFGAFKARIMLGMCPGSPNNNVFPTTPL